MALNIYENLRNSKHFEFFYEVCFINEDVKFTTLTNVKFL